VVAYRGADGLLRIRTSADAVGWSDEIAPPGIAIIAGDPEIIFSGGGSSSFLCAVSPSDQSRVSFYSVSTDGTAEPLSDLKVSTPSRVALVTWDGRLWCVYSDAGNNLELGIAVSDDVGQTWTIGDPLGFGPVLGAPALAVVGSQLLCLWTDQEFGAWPVMMATAVPGEPMPTWTAASNLDPDSSHRSMSGPSAANIGANSIMCVYASGSDDRDVWWTLGSFVVPGP
jgi:hypothetical protein